MPVNPRWPLGPFLAIIIGLSFAVALNVGYTTYMIGYHARQACTELRVLADSKGAVTTYDKHARSAYRDLYKLRCG
jgi:hypothetical protein